jgi:hypothetical protein
LKKFSLAMQREEHEKNNKPEYNISKQDEKKSE